jgi:membrane-bound acyltransferase YfiQ involved in biofilm formation
MQTSVRRLAVVAFICFFPLAIVGLIKERTSTRDAIKLYQISIMICVVFFVLLKGGNFIKPMGTFY